MTPVPPDDDLTARLVKNLQTAWRVEESSRHLHDRYYPTVARYFRRKGVPVNSLDDLTQETFLRVFKGIGGFRRERTESFAAWIAEIATNVFNNWLRTVKAKKRDGIEVSLTGVPREDGQEGGDLPLVDDRPDPLTQLTGRHQEEALHTAIAGLSEQRRRCCELRYIHGLKYREVAVVMNISIETVKAHLHQARAILETALKAAGSTLAGGKSAEGSG